MWFDFFLASAHHIAFLILVAALITEWMLLANGPEARSVASLSKIDLAYGLSAGALLLIGGLRVTMGAKGWAFYSGNPWFWIKLGTFAAIGAASLVPTLRYLRWSRSLKTSGLLPSVEQWTNTLTWVKAQAHALVLLVIAAAAMARGLGS